MTKLLVYGMTPNSGGIEAYIMNYYRCMNHQEIQFDFVVDADCAAYADEITALGGKITYIPSRRDGLLSHVKAMRAAAKADKYTAIYYNILSASAVFSLLATWGLGIRRIVHSHNNAVGNMRTHLLLRPLLNLLTSCRLACSTQAATFMFGDRLGKRTRVINNAIDLQKYAFDPTVRAEVQAEFGLDGHFVVGHVGRLSPQKNTLFLLDIFAEIYRKNTNARLLLIGDGPDRNAVVTKITALHLQDAVIMAGVRSDVARLFQAMDVFLLPSLFEGLPIVGVEAQAAGLRCIFSDTFSTVIDMTGLVTFLPLSTPVAQWADTVLACENVPRADTAQPLRAAGFDIQTQAALVQEILSQRS